MLSLFLAIALQSISPYIHIGVHVLTYFFVSFYSPQLLGHSLLLEGAAWEGGGLAIAFKKKEIERREREEKKKKKKKRRIYILM
jgi:hypothetical protein